MGAGGLPVGTVTFLFTDVVGSTALWEQAPDRMGPAMTRHDELVEAAVSAAGGRVVRPRGEGDSRFAVFTRASDALVGAVAIVRALDAEVWSTPQPIVVRVSVHTGEADLRDGDYYGSAVNRCARLRSLAHPGQILVSEATATLAGATIGLRDLGTHRLKDLSAPEHVHQVEHPDVASDFPPLVSVDVVPNNLPFQVTELVGRAAEVDEITERLASSRLVTLRGPGGTGKSRLSLAVAAELTDRFPDGVWFVELAPVADQDHVASTVASVLDLEGGPDVVDALTRRLADKRVLLVLDNCEHVIDAAAKLVDALLRQTSDTRVLATSQEPLTIHGEAVVALGPLAPADALALFVDRARATNPDFTLAGPEGEAARAICSRLDGIPLALELAANRTRAMSAVQIAERLDDRFRLLTGGSRVGPDRHRTLAAALEWSHDLLPEPEQVLYRRLGVFTGGAALDAVEAICASIDDEVDPYDLFDLLQSLVDRSLVVVDRSHEPPRYRMLETILAHARTKLEADEQQALRHHHLGFFAEQAARGKLGLGSDYTAWFARLNADLDNLRAALAWSLDGGDPTLGLRAVGESGLFLTHRGLNAEATTWFEALLAAAPEEPSGVRAYAMANLGYAYDEAGHGTEAVALLTSAAAMANVVADPALGAEVEYLLGLVRMDITGYREGLAELTRALELYEQVGDDEGVSNVHIHLGEAYLGLGRPADAMTHFEAVERWATAHQDDRRRAHNVRIAVAHLDLGDLDRASALIADRLQQARASGSPLMEVMTSVFAAEVLAAVDLRHGAATLLAAARRSFELELAFIRKDLLVTAATLLVAADVEAATWLAAAAVAFAEGQSRRLPPRMERALGRAEAAGREALGARYDTVWRHGATATPDEVDARVLHALAAVAA